MDISDFEKSTDNVHFPNTENGWKEFRWKLHFLNAKAIVYLVWLKNKEMQARKQRDEVQSN